MIPTNAAVDNSQFAKMAEGIVRLKKVLYLYCPPRSKICAVKPATSASWPDVMRQLKDNPSRNQDHHNIAISLIF